MILNNADNAQSDWTITGQGAPPLRVLKSAMSWGTITPPGQPPYSVTVSNSIGNSAKADNINNPDSLLTFYGNSMIITEPGA